MAQHPPSASATGLPTCAYCSILPPVPSTPSATIATAVASVAARIQSRPAHMCYQSHVTPDWVMDACWSRKCLQTGSCTSSQSLPARHVMARALLCGPHSAIWPLICTVDIFSGSRREILLACLPKFFSADKGLKNQPVCSAWGELVSSSAWWLP